MDDLKKGDVIVWQDERTEVLARLEGLVFTRRLYTNGSVGPVEGAHLIEDLATYGWKKEGK